MPALAGHYLGRAVLIVARSAPEYTVAYVQPQRLGPSMLPAIIAHSVHIAAAIGYLLGRHADDFEYRPDAPRGLILHPYGAAPLPLSIIAKKRSSGFREN